MTYDVLIGNAIAIPLVVAFAIFIALALIGALTSWAAGPPTPTVRRRGRASYLGGDGER
jgi:fructose-specific phosphotransferase system IIC component